VHLTLAHFFGKKPFHGVSALEAVAQGAAIMAGRIKGGTGIPRIQDLEFRDICPLAIGVDVVGDRMSVLIRAGARLPATAKRSFGTVIHGQDRGRFQVFEGPWLMTKRNRLLDSFQVEGIPPAEAGREQIELTFSLDSDRILTVKAAIPSQGTNTRVLEVKKTGCLLGTKAIHRIRAQDQTEKATDAQESDAAARRSWLELVAVNLEKFFSNEPNDPIDGAAFVKMVPEPRQAELLAFVRSKLPRPGAEAPSQQEVDQVFGYVKHHLFAYLNKWKGGIPDWLEPTNPEGYTPDPFIG
jgi:molecular chaperone DnaK (HSP70)